MTNANSRLSAGTRGEPPAATVGSAPRPLTGEPGPEPRAQADPAVAGLQLILKLEAAARTCATEGELVFLIANETRKVVNARQVFVVERRHGAQIEIVGVSSLTSVDRESPAIRWIERLIAEASRTLGAGTAHTFAVSDHGAMDDPEAASYPFGALLWQPLVHRDGTEFGGVLLARETPWSEGDAVVASRLCATFAHAWCALIRPGVLARRSSRSRIAAAVVMTLALLGLALPVPMTALAPAEVVAAEPFVVASPIDGTVAEIAVEPNASVAAGAVLVRFDDTATRNQLELATREVAVAEAKWRQAAQGALIDGQAKRELGILQAEHALKVAERDYARDVLDKSVVHAPRAGLAVFADKRDLTGRPLTIGQRIMEIADPARVIFKVSVPVDDATVLGAGASVRVFLDSDPLHPVPAHIIRASHGARPGENGTLAFRVDARLDDASRPVPRLGVRGTAQLFGERVPLGFYLLRRPITLLRQRFGL